MKNKVIYKCPKCNAHKAEAVFDRGGVKCLKCETTMPPVKTVNKNVGK